MTQQLVGLAEFINEPELHLKIWTKAKNQTKLAAFTCLRSKKRRGLILKHTARLKNLGVDGGVYYLA